MNPSRHRTAKTRATLPNRPDPANRVNEVPGTVSEPRKPSGPCMSRTHQPWISSRFPSIVLLKISAVRANRKTSRSVRNRLVPTTAASSVQSCGPLT